MDDRSVKEIKLPTSWKHVLNDNSKAVENLLGKMAEIVNIHYRIEIFSAPESHSNANISVEQTRTFNNQTDTVRLWNFELEYIFSSCKTTISYRKDINLSKFSNAILNFCLHHSSSNPFDLLVFSWLSCLLAFTPSKKRIDKNCVRNSPKCGNTRVNEN